MEGCQGYILPMGYQESNKHLINICCLPDSKSCLGYALYLPLLQSRCSSEFLFFNEGKHSCNSCVLVTQSCPTLWDLMDCSPPGSSVRGILQTRILEWVVIPFSRDSLLLQFRDPVTSDSLHPHGLQHARPPCPSPSHKVFPSSCPLHQWCHPAILSSDTLFFFCPQPLPSSETFPMSRLFTSEPKHCSFSFSISLFNEYSELISLKIDWFDLLAVQETFRSLLQHHSLKASVLWHSAFFMVQLSQPYVTTGRP